MIRIGLTAGVVALTVGTAAAAQGIPPDTVTTVFVTDTIAGFGAVGGVATDALGYAYIADFRNAVWRLSPDGELIKFADGLYGASGNAMGPRGYLYQSSFHGNYISRISRTGEVETYVADGLNGPVGIAANDEGELFVVNCSGGYISKIGADRSVTEFSRHDLMACPNGITFDDRGDLYVVNFNNTKVLKVTPGGTASEFADIPGAGGNSHIAFAQGTFYVTKLRAHQVFRLQRDGSYAVLAGTGAQGRSDGPATDAVFSRPNGIAVDPGGKVIWVNDLTTGPGAGRGVSVVSLRRIRVVSLSDVLADVDPSDGENGIRSAYDAYAAARPGADTTADAITLGYQWLTSGRFADAVTLFELSSEAFPNNPNAHYHRGEAYRYTGQLERAAEQYKRVLELQPEHPTAAARLAAVTGPRGASRATPLTQSRS